MFRTALMSALVLAGVIGPASAETITVCESGCDYTSIQDAVDAASDSDVIQLSAETYFEGNPINTHGKAITIRGIADERGNPATFVDGQDRHRILFCFE